MYIIYYKNTSINAIVERTTETLGRILLTFDVSFSNTSTLLTPDTKPTMGPGEVLLNGTDVTGTTDAGERIDLEAGVDATGGTHLFYDRAETNFTLSAINETSGSDAIIRVEEVTHVNTI